MHKGLCVPPSLLKRSREVADVQLESSPMSLEERILNRVNKEFGDADRVIAAELLRTYAGRERKRVCWDILELSEGNLDKLRQYVEAARVDYRDILYWAEYFQNDTMVFGRNPKQLVDEILAKWGDTKPLS